LVPIWKKRYNLSIFLESKTPKTFPPSFLGLESIREKFPTVKKHPYRLPLSRALFITRF
jgi:hypothetical protein